MLGGAGGPLGMEVLFFQRPVPGAGGLQKGLKLTGSGRQGRVVCPFFTDVAHFLMVCLQGGCQQEALSFAG